MIEVELPLLEYRDLPLADAEDTRGGEDGFEGYPVAFGDEADEYDDAPPRGPVPPARPALLGRVQVGGPHLRKLTARELAADPEVRQYADARRFEYYLMYLGVSFTAHGSPRLKGAQVAVALTSVPGEVAPAAVWMRPLTGDDKVPVQGRVAFEPKVQVAGVEAGVGSVAAGTSRQRTEVFLRAVGLAGATPGWEFTETKSRRLDGAFPLLAFIQAGHGAVLSVTGTVSAQAKGNIPWRYRGDLPSPLRFSAAS